MAQPWSKGVLLVPPTTFPLPGTVADADDLLADDAGGPIGRNALGLGTVGAGTRGTKPMAVAVKATDHPRPPDDMTVEATGPTGALVSYEATVMDPPSTGVPSAREPTVAHLQPGLRHDLRHRIASSNDKVVPRGRTVPLRFRLAGDEPSGLDTAGWQILRLQVDCADPDRMIASPLAPATSRGGLRYRGDRYLFQSDFRDQPGRTCWRLKVVLDDGSELTSGPFRIAGRATDSPARPARGRELAKDDGRPDRPLQADRPARGSRGSQDRGTKGGRSER